MSAYRLRLATLPCVAFLLCASPASADCEALLSSWLTDHDTTLHYQATGRGSCDPGYSWLTSMDIRRDNGNWDHLPGCAGAECSITLAEGIGCITPGDHKLELRVGCQKPAVPPEHCMSDTDGNAETHYQIVRLAQAGGTSVGPLDAQHIGYDTRTAS